MLIIHSLRLSSETKLEKLVIIIITAIIHIIIIKNSIIININIILKTVQTSTDSMDYSAQN